MENFKNGKNVLYSLLKENLEMVAEDDKLDFYAESTRDVDAKFYLRDGRKNFYNNVMPMHNLHKYYNSVASSAAFAFNILGENEKNFGKGNIINYNNENFVVKEYEKQLDALKSREPAHLDCFISNDEKDVYIETKLTEWLCAPKNLAETYLEKSGYKNEDIYNHFKKYFSDFITDPIMYDNEGRIVSLFTRYDAIQMLIHSLGIFNKYMGTKKKVELWNIVWDIGIFENPLELSSLEPYINMYNEEKEQAKYFINYSNGIITPFFKDNGIDLKIKYIPFSKFYTSVKYPNDNNRIEYLKRYLITI